MKITVGMLKGGASRTTTAIFLALAEQRRSGGKVLLPDADPANGTAFEWAEDAGELWPDDVSVAYWPLAGLVKRVTAAVNDGYGSVVIDTGNDATAIQAGLEVTDHLLVPLAPTGTESARLTPTLTAAAQVAARKPVKLSVILTRVVHGTRSRVGARAALEDMGLHVLETEIPRLEAFANAYGTVPADLGAYAAALDELHEIERSA